MHKQMVTSVNNAHKGGCTKMNLYTSTKLATRVCGITTYFSLFKTGLIHGDLYQGFIHSTYPQLGIFYEKHRSYR